ncbi:o-succinylbenzoate synthase [Baaleninema simplex]|uniref:o-succinylbenzoate synthase n=1 Tax=Baaleninema simplex TaxID=2862350 RepID=UPI0003488562|nr:o-succinylbenzoate synthase [Baaleninema simplex]
MYRFSFFPYRRQFIQPLQTHHGCWKNRQGILLKLTDDKGNLGWGEIAPLPWFGSETFLEALTLCRQSPKTLSKTEIFTISEKFPASQFGFESAWLNLTEKTPLTPELPNSQLLPTGEAVFSILESLKPEAGKTFKWKIGVTDIELELQWFDRLLSSLPPNATLRLDANGGLTWETANRWLAACEGKAIEFLEQPLPVTEFDEMLQLCDRYTTTIALDESVATLRQLETCIRRGWRGIFVVKAAIAGSPTQLRQLCETHRLDTVFSSVFETRIGREAALRLAARLQTVPRAVGFGIEGWFADEVVLKF